jgi:phosphoribosylanthranilate isomerase
MRARIKICGLNSVRAVRAARGADLAGFIFYPPSPRYVTPRQAAHLARHLPKRVTRTAVFVDPTDAVLRRTLARFPANLIQLHGRESPARIAAIRRITGLPVMKAIPLSDADDLKAAPAYASVAARFLFDAKPPKRRGALPGGNALSFDWKILAGKGFDRPWLLSGGLTAANVATALRISRAPGVDISSGVENRPGHKNPSKIIWFIRAAKAR